MCYILLPLIILASLRHLSMEPCGICNHIHTYVLTFLRLSDINKELIVFKSKE